MAPKASRSSKHTIWSASSRNRAKAIRGGHRDGEHKLLWAAQTDGAQRRGSCCPGCNPIVNDNGDPVANVDVLSPPQVPLPATLDLGELAVADCLEFRLLYAAHLNDVFVAHDKRMATVDDRAQGELGW
jgi:hypothetical protein